MQHLTGGEIGIVAGTMAGLFALLAFLARGMFAWMKGKIDEKNGQIQQLVDAAENQIKSAGLLMETVVKLTSGGRDAQETFLAEMRDLSTAQDGRLGALMERLEKALDREG
jgi:enamine deaminase RidA (YjgF/YER057c/UK114 family)